MTVLVFRATAASSTESPLGRLAQADPLLTRAGDASPARQSGPGSHLVSARDRAGDRGVALPGHQAGSSSR